MSKLNAEQIKNALECCIVNDWNSTKCNECPIYNGGGGCIDELKEATLALITSQEQRIKELSEESKKWEEAYDCMHSACRELSDKCERLTDENAEVKSNWQKLKESHENACEKCREEFKKLTEENEYLNSTDIGELQQEYDSLAKSLEGAIELIDKLRAKKAKLTEEVESLKQAMEHEHASFMETFGEYGEKCERLADENERLSTALANYDRQTDVRIAENYYTVEAYEELREENESLHASCTELTQCCTKLETLYNIECKRVDTVKADTVRKIADLLWQGESEKLNICMGGKYYDKSEFIDQIAKEVLEGK